MALVWAAFAGYSCAIGGGDGEEGACVIGTEGCDCTPGGACDPGLACYSNRCVDPGGEGGDMVGPGAGGDETTNGSNSNASNASNSSTAASNGNASSVAASSSSGGPCSLGPPTGVSGCYTCGGACDTPWPAAWSPVSGATHYIVEYVCLQAVSYQTTSTSVDLCNQVGMCNNNLCANGVASVVVKACDATCCSQGATVPDAPLACGGGVCC